MNFSNHLSFEQRFQGLERSNRQPKRVGGVIILSLGAIVLMAQVLSGGSHTVIEPERIVLWDGQGLTRGEWKIDDNGDVRLALRDETGEGYAHLSTTRNGHSFLVLGDGQKRGVASIGIGYDGLPISNFVAAMAA